MDRKAKKLVTWIRDTARYGCSCFLPTVYTVLNWSSKRAECSIYKPGVAV